MVIDQMSDDVGLGRKFCAELLGTFWLVFAGCGSAVLAAGFNGAGIGLLGVALAFGLSVLTMAYAIGHISGCHLNPAVTVGLWTAGRFPLRAIAPYVCAQVLGAILASTLLLTIASGAAHFDVVESGLAQNGYGAGSPGSYSLQAAWLTESILTGVFLIVILGATDPRAPVGFAPIAIGLALTLIHLISIPVTNTSVNPARSTGPALLLGGLAFQQLWLFWVAPLLGGVAGGLLYRFLLEESKASLAVFNVSARTASAAPTADSAGGSGEAILPR
jgi:aquaporin Z